MGRCDSSRGEITEGWKHKRRITGSYCLLELKQTLNLLNKRLLCSCDANHLQLVAKSERSLTHACFPLQTRVQPKDQKKTHKMKLKLSLGARTELDLLLHHKNPKQIHIYTFPGRIPIRVCVLIGFWFPGSSLCCFLSNISAADF